MSEINMAQVYREAARRKDEIARLRAEVERLRWERDLHEARADRLGWEKARMRECMGIPSADLQQMLDDLWNRREGR